MNNAIGDEPLGSITPTGFLQPLVVGKKILLVEDDAFVREIASEILESAGCCVLTARNAASAKSASEYRQIHLLISDVVLPGQNGFQLAEDLRKNNPAMKVILMSGYPQNAVARSIPRQNGVAYLPKPFTADALLKKVREVLDDPGPRVI